MLNYRRMYVAPVALFFVVSACKFGKETHAAGASKCWDEMDRGERMAHMSSSVAPKMKTMFQEHDAQQFADFGCATCHGPGAADGTYAMPNPELPHIDKTKHYKKHRQQHAKILKFMWKELVPEMGRQLGQTWGEKGQLYCQTCHVIEGH